MISNLNMIVNFTTLVCCVLLQRIQPEKTGHFQNKGKQVFNIIPTHIFKLFITMGYFTFAGDLFSKIVQIFLFTKLEISNWLEPIYLGKSTFSRLSISSNFNFNVSSALHNVTCLWSTHAKKLIALLDYKYDRNFQLISVCIE